MANAKARTKKTSKQSTSSSHHGAGIAAILIGILVLALGGLAVWFFAYYNNPEKVAYDTIEHLLSSRDLALQGGFTYTVPDDQKGNSPIDGFIVSFDSSSNTLPTANSAKLQLIFNDQQVDGEPTFVLTIKNLIMRDGVIYLQIGGIMDSLQTFSYSYDEWSKMETYTDLLEVIDNEWWQIDVRDIVANLELPDEQTNGINRIYSCVVSALNRDMSTELANLYSTYRFIEIQPAKRLAPEESVAYPEKTGWYGAYEVSLNRGKLAGFINSLPETAAANDFYNCYNGVIGDSDRNAPQLDASDFPEISIDDIKWPEDLRIFLEISRFGHELRSAYVYQNSNTGILDGSILVEHQDNAVSTPNNYRPISDLIDELSEILTEFIPYIEEEE